MQACLLSKAGDTPTLQSRGYLSKLEGLHSIQKLAISTNHKRSRLVSSFGVIVQIIGT